MCPLPPRLQIQTKKALNNIEYRTSNWQALVDQQWVSEVMLLGFFASSQFDFQHSIQFKKVKSELYYMDRRLYFFNVEKSSMSDFYFIISITLQSRGDSIKSMPLLYSILRECLTAIKERISFNFLQLNSDKTEIIICRESRAQRLWNSLPDEIRLAKSLPVFKSLLKTYFYWKAFFTCVL